MCLNKFPKDAKLQAKHQERLGCDGRVNPHLVYTPNYSMKGRPKIKYSKCIGNYFNFSSMELVRYYAKFKENVFPYNGSYYEQPNKFVEAMELVQNLFMEHKEQKEATLKRFGKK
jgi:hypothetical protein